MYHPISRRSKPIKDQFYDDIFPRDYLDDETDDEDEVIPLPTQAKVDQMVELLNLFDRVIQGRGFINCHCKQPIYDSLDLISHTSEKHIIRKPIVRPREVTEEDKMFHKHIQEEAFFGSRTEEQLKK